MIVSKNQKNKDMQKQTAEIVRLMRRSVVSYESKERNWSEEMDPQSVSEERVQMLVLSSSLDMGRVVGEWLEDSDLR
jgi:hypothetical protein